MKLTIQQLANLCMYSWELQRDLGFHMQDTAAFRGYIANMPATELKMLMENLGLLFRTIREIGEVPIELKSEGNPSLWAPLCTTQTAHACGADEKIESEEPK